MNARYVIKEDPHDLGKHFDLAITDNFPARYNIAPSQPVPIIRQNDRGLREYALVRWGFVPGWDRKGEFFKRSIVNILNNALRYGRDVEVRAERTANAMARVIVMDRGPGVPEDQLETILQPFRRVSGAKGSERTGTGLGLAIANRFAALNGGALMLKNRPGGGLRAELLVCAAPPEA